MSETVAILDSHCHIDMVIDRGISYDKITANLAQSGVSGFVQIGASPEEMHYARNFAHQAHTFDVWYTIGAHPGEAHEIDASLGIQFARENQNDKKFVAVGEIGLDYYYNRDTEKIQKEVFRDYLKLSVEINKPVCIHTRDAAADTAEILAEINPPATLIHCFTGNRQEMERFLELGCYISFSGIVTFKSAKDLQEAARHCPLERIMVETDAPYLAPVPHRGKTNEPALVRDTLKFIAGLKGTDMNELAHRTVENTRALYRI